MPLSSIQLLGKVHDTDYTIHVRDAVLHELESVKGCDAKNLTRMVMSYTELTVLELSYKIWSTGLAFSTFKKYETEPSYIPHKIIEDMIRYPSKYPMIGYQSLQNIVQDWLIESPNEAIEALLSHDLNSKTMADFREIFESFMKADGITDSEIDLCYHLGWILWICFDKDWRDQYKNVFKNHTSLNDEELEIFRNQVCHLHYATHKYGCGRRGRQQKEISNRCNIS